MVGYTIYSYSNVRISFNLESENQELNTKNVTIPSVHTKNSLVRVYGFNCS